MASIANCKRLPEGIFPDITQCFFSRFRLGARGKVHLCHWEGVQVQKLQESQRSHSGWDAMADDGGLMG